MTEPHEQIAEGAEFKVKQNWGSIAKPGVRFKVEAIENDDIVVLVHRDRGPDEIDVPKEIVVAALNNGVIVPNEHDPHMHD